MPKIQITQLIDKEDYFKLNKEAKKRGVTAQTLIRTIIKQFLNNDK